MPETPSRKNRRPLIESYKGWLLGCDRSEKELLAVIDALVMSTIGRTAVLPLHRPCEDVSDLVQHLRAVGFAALRRIENPTSKRIYNYLRVSIYGALLTKSNSVKRSRIKDSLAPRTGSSPADSGLPTFYDPLIDEVARLLSEGLSRAQIMKTMNITRHTLTKTIDIIKEVYTSAGTL